MDADRGYEAEALPVVWTDAEKGSCWGLVRCPMRIHRLPR